MGSFKVRLAAYFALMALVPFAAAFQGFDSIAHRSETRRVDAVLQSALRSALVAYGDELGRTQARAERFAHKRELQRALAARDRAGLARLIASTPNLRIEAPRGLTVGPTRVVGATEAVAVVTPGRRLGSVVAILPLDGPLTRRLQRHAGLEPAQRLVFVERGRVAAGKAPRGAQLRAKPGHATTVSLAGTRYRVLASDQLREPSSTALVLLAPQRAIDRAASSIEERLTLMMVIALILLVLIAYFEGRAIVRTLGGFVGAANDIARGHLDRRVKVRGRDEFARLGLAFNDMADQLEARLQELEEEKRRLRDVTMRFGEALAATHDVQGLLRVVVETAMESTGALSGVLIDDHGEIVRKGDAPASAQRLEFPLAAGGETFGTLVLAAESFSKEQTETASWLVGHAVIALENARLHRTVQRQALVDSLTGLANRRLCEAALEKEIARAERFEEPLAVIVADLDDFKLVNDRHGHATGDQVLREFANALKGTVREIDLAGRWGGEEFVVALPGTDLAGGALLGERVRKAFAKRVIVAPNGARLTVTASIGVAAFAGQGGVNELLAAADTALYRAKRAGKDRVATAETSGETSVGAASLGA